MQILINLPKHNRNITKKNFGDQKEEKHNSLFLVRFPFYLFSF